MQWNAEFNNLDGKSAARSTAQDVNGTHELAQPVYDDPDAIALARTGKKQVLERRFGLVSMTGFSCGLMCTWESTLVVFLLGLQNGGPGGLVCGFIFVWFGTTSVFATISELASMVPTAAGQYHWVGTLAGGEWKRFSSYIMGRYTSECELVRANISAQAGSKSLPGLQAQWPLHFSLPRYCRPSLC